MKVFNYLFGILVVAAVLFLSLRIYCPSIWIDTSKFASMDTENPFLFTGKQLIYQGDTIILGKNAIFIDGNMTDREAKRFSHVFNSFQEAASYLVDGNEEAPMMVYIAPNVYWIDDPDDPEIRKPANGGTPYGMVIPTNHLYLKGLTTDPQNVVLACNRGQTQGAIGNFTMFRFEGNDIRTENITFGNYCNVDLVYPLRPELNREKRMEAITQAQLILCKSDKVYAKNCSFISRLNSCPFVGSKRAFFEECHFECTDDALCGSAVYLRCDLDFYSSKPFWSTHGTGAVFLDCDFNLLTQDAQYLTKVGSQVALVDCRFHHEGGDIRLEWTQYPKESMRCYQYNVSLNDKPILFHAGKPILTVDMKGKQLLNAYRIERNEQVVYNIYGLLRANDEWDPLSQKEMINRWSAIDQIDYANIPTMIRINPTYAEIESGVSNDTLSYEIFRFGDIPYYMEAQWEIGKGSDVIKIKRLNDSACIAFGVNYNELAKDCRVDISTTSGLEAAATVRVSPKFLKSPIFIQAPNIGSLSRGRLRVYYQLNLNERNDHSLITWYRCKDADGSEPIEVAVSRLNQPEYVYTLTPGDIGHYLMVSVSPKHVRSHPGEPMTAIYKKIILEQDVYQKEISTNFQDFPTTYQKQILPGYWTVDTYKPIDTQEYDWTAHPSKAWFYGSAEGGAKGYGLLQATKGARLLYTPIDSSYGDMSVSLNVDPCKTAGQGFGSATGQYMDIYIKFDTKTLSGYALRIVRTTKYANAVDFILVQYQNGQVKEISEAVSATCYRTDCNIQLKIAENVFTADVTTSTHAPTNANPALVHEVHLKTDVEGNIFGGSGIQHTGSTGSGATMLHEMKISWL